MNGGIREVFNLGVGSFFSQIPGCFYCINLFKSSVPKLQEKSNNCKSPERIGL